MTAQRSIDVFLFHDTNIMDVAGPVQAFDNARAGGGNAYSLRYLSVDGNPVRTSCGLQLSASGSIMDHTPDSDLLIPGGTGVDTQMECEAAMEMIRTQAAYKNDSRLISVCSGALLLAKAGVLDGLEATTHWSRAHMAKTLFPDVNWALDRIFTRQGNIFTSAGVSTGIDLALSIIQQDCGPTQALAVAQELVVHLRRGGGQSQYSDLLEAQFNMKGPLARLAEKVSSDPARNWRLEDLAQEANMSSRTLSRKFSESLGVSPVQFVELTRLEYARAMLGEGASKKQVAAKSGFGDLQRMRRSFQRHLGVSASEYEDRFGQSDA